MNVLSLFDGISCGHVALIRGRYSVDSYFASEIDENASRSHRTTFLRQNSLETYSRFMLRSFRK